MRLEQRTFAKPRITYQETKILHTDIDRERDGMGDQFEKAA